MCSVPGLLAPSLTLRSTELLVPDGESTIFEDDLVVIVPHAGDTAVRDVVMQYRISAYSGSAKPLEGWQDARKETWKGEHQWCFALPRGRMSVIARTVSTEAPLAGGVSEPSAVLRVCVRGTCSRKEMWLS